MEKLEQRYLLKKKEFELKEKGIVIRTHEFSEYAEVTVPYEDITRDSTISKSSSKRWFIAGTVFLLIALICIIYRLTGEDVDSFNLVVWAICAAVCFGIYILKYESIKKIMLTNGKAIYFFLDKPNDKIFNEFICNLYIKRNEYLKERYAKIDTDLPLEQMLYRINWLKENEIINNDEFVELKTLITEGKKSHSVGFQPQQKNI
jgi:hypothetical protein